MSVGARARGAVADGRAEPETVTRGAVALLLPNLAMGGAERNLLRLAGELHRRGRPVDLVLGSATGPLRSQIPPGVAIVDLGRPRLRSAVLPLAGYLRRTRPPVLLATVGHANVLAVLAARLAGVDTRVVTRVAASLAGRDEGASLGRKVSLGLYRAAYRRADGLVANSHGSAEALAEFLGIERSRVRYLPNLTVGPELAASADATVDHPWFQPGEPPVVLSVARLAPVKDHRLLIDAVARVRDRRPVRLLILGEGPLRGELEAFARDRGIGEDVQLLGVVDDPLPYLRHAAAYCLSSNREGMPNALIEALACGCPVVATDCHSGPRELLAGGRYGRLVPVGDVEALTEGLLEALEDGRPAPREAWAPHTVEGAGEAYDRYLDELVGEATGGGGRP